MGCREGVVGGVRRCSRARWQHHDIGPLFDFYISVGHLRLESSLTQVGSHCCVVMGPNVRLQCGGVQPNRLLARSPIPV